MVDFISMGRKSRKKYLIIPLVQGQSGVPVNLLLAYKGHTETENTTNCFAKYYMLNSRIESRKRLVNKNRSFLL